MTTMDEVATTLQKLWPRAKALTRNRAEAEDLMQDTFLRAVRFLDSLGDGQLIAWLHTMMYRLFLSSRRHGAGAEGQYSYKRRLISIEEIPGFDVPHRTTPDVEWDVERTLETISKLVPMHRQVLELSLNGATYKQMARVAGCQERTVKTRLFRAREALAHRMESGHLPKTAHRFTE